MRLAKYFIKESARVVDGHLGSGAGSVPRLGRHPYIPFLSTVATIADTTAPATIPFPGSEPRWCGPWCDRGVRVGTGCGRAGLPPVAVVLVVRGCRWGASPAAAVPCDSGGGATTSTADSGAAAAGIAPDTGTAKGE